MISHLTSEQSAKIPVYVQKWKNYAIRPSSTNPEKTIRAVNFFYEKILMQDKPENITTFSSLKECIEAYHQCPEKIYDTSPIRKTYLRKLEIELERQLTQELAVIIYAPFYKSLRNYFNLKNNIVSFLPAWISASEGDLCRYAFSDYLLEEIFPEKKERLLLYVDFLKHIQEIHCCWFFEKTAFVANFPRHLAVNLREETEHSATPSLNIL